ncbi:MAG: AAC(3) family N-acetyltransferase [Polyangiales bacterium]
MLVHEVIDQLRALGVREGGVLLVHTSFRALRPIEGGPLGLIRALRAVAGTLVMPTMTDGESVFDPRQTPTTDMGITAETFWRLPGVLRSTHPGGSFAAVGPEAARICAEQPLSPPHGHDSPVGRVYDLDGQVLLLGVGHSENTTLHLAESLADVPYSIAYPTVIAEGETALIAETDHCCRNFAQADAWLGALQQRGPVGRGEARLMSSRELVARALEHLERDPLVFLCQRDCDECAAARASVAALR